MIDLHCHLLPGTDDGLETIEEALEMADIAVVNGIEAAHVTPHLHSGRWDNNLLTNSGSRCDISAIVRRQTMTGCGRMDESRGAVRLGADRFSHPFINEYEALLETEDYVVSRRKAP